MSVKNVLYSENLPGNLHDAATIINKIGLADYVIHLESSGYNSIVVYRLPPELRNKLWRESGRIGKPQ